VFYTVVWRHSTCGVDANKQQILQESTGEKNCENWSIFSEDMDKGR